MDYDYLDRVAESARQNEDDQVGVLSTSERLYVAMASGRMDLMDEYTIAHAIDRLGLESTEIMVHRWRYR